MPFEDKIRQVIGDQNSASFRGIPFRLGVDTNEGGRRGTTHQYIFRDNPFREDTGRMAEGFTIDGFIDGNNNQFNGQTLDYIQIRDLLRDAMRNDPSPGILILPTYGEFEVSPIRFRIVTDNRRKGICQLQLTFVESGELEFPSVTDNLVETAEINADALADAVTSEAGSGTILTQDPDSGVNESEDIMNEFTKSTDIALETGEQDQSSLEDFNRKFNNYKEQVRSKLFTPTEFYTDTQEIYDELRQVWPDDELNDAFDSFRDIFNSAVDDIGKLVDIDTIDRINQQKNSQLLRDGVRNVMLSQMSIITANQVFASNQQVQQRRDLIIDLFEQQIENASDNFDKDQRDNLVNLRTTVLVSLEAVGGDLPDEQTVFLINSLSAFELANDLYGDALRGQEIADANEALNPLFLPAQTEMKVLSF